MSITIPNLDDITYAELVEEARALIPIYDPEWTDHNPSDPGITLIELFAWITEALIYRANQVTRAHRIAFMKLLEGPDWQPGDDLDEDLRTAVLALRQRYRAVTASDYEALAREASSDVLRAKLVANRNLAVESEAGRSQDQPGHVSLIIVTQQGDKPPLPQPDNATSQKVWQLLDERRVLTIRHHVCGPVYVPIGMNLQIARRADMPEDKLGARVEGKLGEYFSLTEGGPDGTGWPFGRSVYVSEVIALLESIEGVDHVPEIELFSRMPTRKSRRVLATEQWHPNGDLVGLALEDHHLPELMLDLSEMVFAADFVPVTLSIEVVPLIAKEETRRLVKTTVRRLFSPHYSEAAASWKTQAWQVSLQDIRNSLTALEKVIDPGHVVVTRLEKADSEVISFGTSTLADVRIDLSFVKEVS